MVTIALTFSKASIAGETNPGTITFQQLAYCFFFFTSDRFGKHFPRKSIVPNSWCISDTFFGAGSSTIGLTLPGLSFTPFSLITFPK